VEWIYNLQVINRSGSLTTRVLEHSCKVQVVCMYSISSYCVGLEYVRLKGNNKLYKAHCTYIYVSIS